MRSALASAMRHNPSHGIMAEFMEGRAVPVDRLEVSLRRRHLHEIAQWAVEGPRATDAKIRSGRRDQPLGLRLDHAGRWRGRGLRDLFRQTVELIGIRS